MFNGRRRVWPRLRRWLRRRLAPRLLVMRLLRLPRKRLRSVVTRLCLRLSMGLIGGPLGLASWRRLVLVRRRACLCLRAVRLLRRGLLCGLRLRLVVLLVLLLVGRRIGAGDRCASPQSDRRDADGHEQSPCDPESHDTLLYSVSRTTLCSVSSQGPCQKQAQAMRAANLRSANEKGSS